MNNGTYINFKLDDWESMTQDIQNCEIQTSGSSSSVKTIDSYMVTYIVLRIFPIEVTIKD